MGAVRLHPFPACSGSREHAEGCSDEEAGPDRDLALLCVSHLLNSPEQRDAYVSFLEVVAKEFVRVEV
jgi:hypothetical protein